MKKKEEKEEKEEKEDGHTISFKSCMFNKLLFDNLSFRKHLQSIDLAVCLVPHLPHLSKASFANETQDLKVCQGNGI